MKSDEPATFRFEEEGNKPLQVLFAVVLLVILVQHLAVWIQERQLRPSILDVLFVGAFFAVGAKTEIRITPLELIWQRSIGPWRRIRQYPLETVAIKIEVFSFDPWDPHVAIHCGDDQEIRVAWGLPESEIRAIAVRLQDAIDARRGVQ
jgi:hypothetical protein